MGISAIATRVLPWRAAAPSSAVPPEPRARTSAGRHSGRLSMARSACARTLRARQRDPLARVVRGRSYARAHRHDERPCPRAVARDARRAKVCRLSGGASTSRAARAVSDHRAREVRRRVAATAAATDRLERARAQARAMSARSSPPRDERIENRIARAASVADLAASSRSSALRSLRSSASSRRHPLGTPSSPARLSPLVQRLAAFAAAAARHAQRPETAHVAAVGLGRDRRGRRIATPSQPTARDCVGRASARVDAVLRRRRSARASPARAAAANRRRFDAACAAAGAAAASALHDPIAQHDAAHQRHDAPRAVCVRVA